MKYIILIPLIFLSVFTIKAQKKLDILIKNARIIDGTGNPWFYGDIGIRKGKVYKIGSLGNYTATSLINANNQVAAPGFIDVHGHIESSILQRPDAANFIYDGVTSIITGNCGGSRTDIKTFFKELKQTGTSINVASLIGHNSVRRAILGEANRAPTNQELLAMQQLVEQAMIDGAVGFSTGLIYVPGTYSETEEVIALAKAAAKYNGVYASHIRNEGNNIVEAIEEAVNIGAMAKMPVEISHFKLSGRPMWNKNNVTIGLVEKFRAEGIDVTVDQYPYPASSTTLAVTLPTWALAGGTDSLAIRLQDPKAKNEIKAAMKRLLDEKEEKDFEYCAIANCPWEQSYNGKRIPEVTEIRTGSKDLDAQIETILEMVAKGPRIQMVFHSMDPEDVKAFMRYPYTMIASDAGIPAFGRGVPHPRAYGTNSRVLGYYVRELQNLRLEGAIRKMTSLPAQKFGLRDRGLIKEGMAADIVIFDPETVTDKATFEKPHAYAEGFSHVIVNGVIVLENGQHNQKKAGTVLRLND